MGHIQRLEILCPFQLVLVWLLGENQFLGLVVEYIVELMVGLLSLVLVGVLFDRGALENRELLVHVVVGIILVELILVGEAGGGLHPDECLFGILGSQIWLALCEDVGG